MNETLKNNLVASLGKGLRLDGRKLDEIRPITVKPGIISTADGSAEVTWGDTKVIVGVKLGMEKPFSDTPEDGVLMVNAELLPMSNPKYEPGPPSIGSIELSRVIDRGIRESGCLDTKKLCVTKGEKVWSVLIDIAPINDDGNLLDVCGFAALCALKNVEFPEFDGEKVNFEKKSGKKLQLAKEPLPITIRKVGKLFLVDPTEAEDEATDSRLTITYLEDGTLCSLQKGGNKAFLDTDVSEMLKIAKKATDELRKHIPQ